MYAVRPYLINAQRSVCGANWPTRARGLPCQTLPSSSHRPTLSHGYDKNRWEQDGKNAHRSPTDDDERSPAPDCCLRSIEYNENSVTEECQLLGAW